ncbi:MAG: hypothetical protein KGL39_05775 [Patescibacteria group bacterium]|nr:hypothetical protein [Patescibacteria group bacterium]
MTDGELVRLARQIDNHLNRVIEIYRVIQSSDHPRVKTLVEDMHDNQFGAYSLAAHVVYHHLVHPERWETDDFGIHLKRSPRPPGAARKCRKVK